jgi:hypothetical protein
MYVAVTSSENAPNWLVGDNTHIYWAAPNGVWRLRR